MEDNDLQLEWRRNRLLVAFSDMVTHRVPLATGGFVDVHLANFGGVPEEDLAYFAAAGYVERVPPVDGREAFNVTEAGRAEGRRLRAAGVMAWTG